MAKWKSRKFVVTVFGMLGATVLGALGRMDGDVALVYAAGIAAYNYANAKVEESRKESYE